MRSAVGISGLQAGEDVKNKVAALYAQHLNDAVVLAAVNDIEALAASLSNKVWQKIMILDNPRAESTV